MSLMPAIRHDCPVPVRGESAVVVPVAAAEAVVSAWRERFDSSAMQGMPAHVTALYPFLGDHDLTEGVLAGLSALCGEFSELRVRFDRPGRFPGVLWLDPEPAAGLLDLTVRIASRWPQAPPYGGQFADVVPHLTVACGQEATLDAVEAEITPRLPITAVLTAARLYVFDGSHWQPRAELPFHGPRGSRILSATRPAS